MSRVCRHCNAITVRTVTDGHGRAVEVAEPCKCMRRRARGLCRTCPSPLPERRNHNTVYCARCASERKRKAVRDWCRRKHGYTGTKQPAHWRKDINDARRLAGQCQLCNRAVTGKPKVALYCERHRKLAKKAAFARSQKKGQYWRTYQQRHRNEIRAKQRARHAKDWRRRKKRAEYKRQWRKRNRDKVRAQKRRYALRGRSAEAAHRHRAKYGRTVQQPTRRNERGERLCVRDGCPSVLHGRAKLCERCKAMDVCTIPQARSA